MISRTYRFHVADGASGALVDAYRRMVAACRRCDGFISLQLLMADEPAGLAMGISFWDDEESLAAYAAGEHGRANVALMDGLLAGEPEVVRWEVSDLG